jgi:DHA1 family tetracycline resistance protein-like MFS transporter
MSPLAIVILIVLIDLLGFALVMPLLGPFAKQYQFAGWQLGLLFAAYPICQLVAGPILGRLSDRYGRRPLLVFSQAGTALSFLILGLSRNFRVMLLGRMLDGASGGNIVVAQAYVADVTPPEHRTRNMGLIGMAFGVGFVLGPLLGALLSDLPVAPDWRLRLPFLVAAGFSTLAWILVVWKLPESIPAGSAPRQAARVLSRRGVVDTIRLPGIARLMTLAFLSVLAWATMEGTFALFLQERMGWSPSAIGFAFAGSGLVSALVQGGLIRPLVPRYGEIKLIVVGIVLAGAGFVEVAMLSSGNVGLLAAAVVMFSVGSGLVSPSISGLLSRITPMTEQGAVFGALTSTQTLARIISYLTGNILLARVSPSAPYWFGATVYLAALIAAAWFAPNIAAVLARSQEQAPAEEVATAEQA